MVVCRACQSSRRLTRGDEGPQSRLALGQINQSVSKISDLVGGNIRRHHQNALNAAIHMTVPANARLFSTHRRRVIIRPLMSIMVKFVFISILNN
jgi:hypothetical protein